MEERREVLDLAAAGPELEHAAPVEPDPALLTMVVEAEELAEAPEAGGLRVQRAWRERELLDIGDRVDRRVPRDALLVRLERELRLVGERRILEVRLGEALRDAAIEVCVRR